MIEWCKRLNNSFTFLVIDWLPIRLIKLLINSFIILVIDWLPSRRGYLTKRWCSAGSRLCSCNLRHSAHNNNNPTQVFLLSPNVVGPQKNGTTGDSCVFFTKWFFDRIIHWPDPDIWMEIKQKKIWLDTSSFRDIYCALRSISTMQF